MLIYTQPFSTGSYFLFDKVDVKAIGPLPLDEHGKKYSTIFIGCFSRYVCLYPVPDITGLNKAKPIIKYCGRHPIDFIYISIG